MQSFAYPNDRARKFSGFDGIRIGVEVKPARAETQSNRANSIKRYRDESHTYSTAQRGMNQRATLLFPSIY